MPSVLRPLAVALCLVALPACDSATEDADDPTVSGLYARTYVDDLDGVDVEVSITLDIPPTTDGTFALGPGSRLRVETDANADTESLDGSGTVSGRDVRVTIDELPDISVGAAGAVALAFVGADPTVVSGTVSADGDRITFTSGGETAVFVRE